MTRHTAFRSVAAAATLAASTLLAGAPAEAGGGTRLNFGGPLGTFVATPTPGYGGGSGYAAPRKSPPKTQHAKRPAADPADRPRATVARVKPARSPAPTLAKASDVKPSEDTGSGASPPVKVTHTLTAAELPRSETVADSTPAEAVAATTASEQETGSVDAGSADKADEAPAAAAPVETGPVGCRKFIPSVGVTVTVSCE